MANMATMPIMKMVSRFSDYEKQIWKDQKDFSWEGYAIRTHITLLEQLETNKKLQRKNAELEARIQYFESRIRSLESANFSLKQQAVQISNEWPSGSCHDSPVKWKTSFAPNHHHTNDPKRHSFVYAKGLWNTRSKQTGRQKPTGGTRSIIVHDEQYKSKSFEYTNKNANKSGGEVNAVINTDLQEKLEEIIKDLQKKLSSADAQIKDLLRRKTILEQRVADEIRRSDKITHELAGKMERGKCFENVNDVFSNSNIVRRLESLYENDWANVFRTLGRNNPDMGELQKVKLLSVLIKRCYEECTKLVDGRLRQFMFLEDTEPLPDNEELQEVVTQRRQLYRSEKVRINVKKNILNMIMASDETKQLQNNQNEVQVLQKYKNFFEQLIDSCWLVSISHPPIKLNFDVVGKQHEDVKDRWTIYSTKKRVEDMNKLEGTIIEVVWPSVELKDESGHIRKGDVIIVNKGLKH